MPDPPLQEGDTAPTLSALHVTGSHGIAVDGVLLDEIENDITRVTPASFEPALDYVIVKIPRWNFEKFEGVDEELTTQMKAVGEVMANVCQSLSRIFFKIWVRNILNTADWGLLYMPAITR